jgi:hypothetical protein
MPDKYYNNVKNTFDNGYIYYKDGEIIGCILWKIREEYIPNKPSYIRTQYFKNLSNRVKRCIDIPGKRPDELTVLLVCCKLKGNNFFKHALKDVETYAIEKCIFYILLEPVNNTIKEYYQSYGFHKYKKNTTNKRLVKPVNITFRKSNLKHTLKSKYNTVNKKLLKKNLKHTFKSKHKFTNK